jgi:hypothetical protein
MIVIIMQPLLASIRASLNSNMSNPFVCTSELPQVFACAPLPAYSLVVSSHADSPDVTLFFHASARAPRESRRAVAARCPSAADTHGSVSVARGRCCPSAIRRPSVRQSAAAAPALGVSERLESGVDSRRRRRRRVLELELAWRQTRA